MSLPEPTIGAKDTAKTVTAFIKEHKPYFWQLVKQVAPYLLLVLLISMVLNYFSMKDMFAKIDEVRAGAIDPESISNPFYTLISHFIALIDAYIFAVVAVSWHRLCLQPVEQYRPMNILKPEKHEIEFVLMWCVIGYIIPVALTYLPLAFGAGGLSTVIAVISGLTLVFIFPYLIYKFSFYFPAKAINQSVTFGQSFQLTKGYFWKVGWAYLLAAIVPIILMIVYMLGITFLSAPVMALFAQNAASGTMDASFMIPSMAFLFISTGGVIIYFVPLFTVIGVTVLSNYFQHSLHRHAGRVTHE